MKIYKVEQRVNFEGAYIKGYFKNYPSVKDVTSLGMYFLSTKQIEELVESGDCSVSYNTTYCIAEQEVTEN